MAFTDINECMANTDDCDTNAVCTNTPGSFTCDCNQGYSGDGLNCVGKYSSPGLGTLTQWPLQILMNVWLILMTVTLMLSVPTPLVASPVTVTRATVEMDLTVWVSSSPGLGTLTQ